MPTTGKDVKANLNWPFIALILFCIAVYAPLVIHGGIIVDDWGDIAHNLDCNGFIHCYQTWFPLFSNRPLAPLPITLSTFIFGNFFKGYLLLNSLVYLSAVLITRRALSQVIGSSASIMFALFAVIPFIAMPVITSPINQLTATVSFLLWALSTASLMQYLNHQKTAAYILSYVYLLLAFLNYEVILPLLTITALIPFVLNANHLQRHYFNYFFRFIAPLALVLGIVVLWQKGIAPHFMDVDSRLKISPADMLAKLHTWGHVFYAQIPALFIKSLNHATVFQIFTSLVLILCTWLTYGAHASSTTSSAVRYRFFMVSALCFISSSSIFILSNESANSWGYQARGLSSTWFALSILIASFASFITSRKSIILVLITIFGFFSCLAFLIQRDNYIKSWELQMVIIEDAIKLIKSQSVPPKAVVIGDVPKFVNPNFNDEIVFSQPWDFGGALSIFTQGQVKDGAVIDSRNKNFNRLIVSNQNISLNGWWETSFDNLWLYEFNPTNQNGKLSKIHSAADFQEKLGQLGFTPNQAKK